MKPGLWCLVCAVFAVCSAAAQHPDDEYYPYGAEPEERTNVLLPDSAIFYRAILSAEDLYGAVTDFNLPSVALKRRGQPFYTETASFYGVETSYRYFTTLRALGAQEYRYAGIAATAFHPGGAGGIREFRLPTHIPAPAYRAAVGFTDRNYLAALKFSALKELGRGWYGALALDGRTGRDMYVEGVFTNAVTAGLSLSKDFGGHNFSLLVVIPPSVRGLRSAATEEAFMLTGDNLYNPSWGLQDGKVRSSRVRREFVPMAVVSYAGQLSTKTSLTAAFGVEAGVSRLSALGWYDASTPLPDNYRYMPGYTGDREAAQAWRDRDPRYTQIDWDELIRRNRMGGGEAAYALEDRTRRLCDLQFAATATTEADERLTLHYGVVYRRSSERSYKQMRDLLGADRIVDIDQYLIDDDTYNNLLQNDLRNPDRAVREGGRFGYDYALVSREMGAQASAVYRSDRLRADVSASVRDAVVYRRGYYEKELFPGAQSYGLSRRMRFTPYTFKATVGWAFSPRNYLDASFMAAAQAPRADDLFFQPQYNNRTADRPVAERVLAAELNYRFTSRKLSLQVAVFVTSTRDGAQMRRYYDDLSSTFCDMVVSGIGLLMYGLEAAAEVRLSYRWSVSAAISAGQYKYGVNPRVTVLSDVDNEPVLTDAESYMGGCRIGGTPQFTALAGVNYFGAKGWGARASAGYAAGRYVDPMPLRRTERMARQGGSSHELFDAFTAQERLGDAFTLDLALFKTFYFEESRLTASLSVRNLLGGRDVVYSGYESLRVRRLGEGLYAPHDTRYTYSYPRSFYLTVSYRF